MAAQMLPGASMLSGRRAVPAAHSARTVGISGLGARPGGALRPLQTCQPRSKRTKVVVREVTSTETVPSDAATSAAYAAAAAAAAVSASNGNGNGNGNSNGNGNGNGNGQKAAAQLSSRLNSVAANAAAASSVPVTVADINAAAMPGAVANGTAVKLNSAIVNGTAVKLNGAIANGNGNGNGSTAPYVLTATTTNSNGTAATVAVATDSAQTAAAWKLMNTIDEEQNAEAAGQLELAAATAGASSSRASDSASSSDSGTSTSSKRSAAGTPYRNPGGRWSKFKSYSVFQRTMEIWGFAATFAVKYLLLRAKWTYGKTGMTPDAVAARKRTLAVWLREGLVKLGPTFIKIGQQFSTRVDVLSPEFVKELEKLQDNVPPFDTMTALQILESNLGAPPSEVFAEFEETPIAAASLGQVHLARLKTGERVVVKVQRPGLKELFDIDLKNIRALAVWLQKVDPKNDGAARDWVAIYDECSRILYQEIDYRGEAANAQQFADNFKGQDWIKVPRVYWEFTSSEVLVLEYVPGVKINDGQRIDAMGLDRQRLARLAVESYLQQILRHGFFHADPHPGNVAVDATGGGRLIYYDFGMMGSIPGGVRGGLLELFYGVYNKDADKCLDALITMGVLVPTGDRLAVRRTAQFFLNSFQERLDQQRKEKEAKGKAYNEGYKPQRSKDEAKERRKAILSSIGEDLLVASADQPFRFPATFTFVVRAFTVLDGIGKSLDPRFDISEISAPYARELLLETKPQFAKAAESFNKAWGNQNRAVANLFKNPNRIEEVAATMDRLESGDLKLRVRALEAERALTRVQAWQRVVAAALAASTLVNVGTVLSVSALSTGATLSFAGAGVFGVMLMASYLKVVNLERKEAQLMGTA